MTITTKVGSAQFRARRYWAARSRGRSPSSVSNAPPRSGPAPRCSATFFRDTSMPWTRLYLASAKNSNAAQWAMRITVPSNRNNVPRRFPSVCASTTSTTGRATRAAAPNRMTRSALGNRAKATPSGPTPPPYKTKSRGAHVTTSKSNECRRYLRQISGPSATSLPSSTNPKAVALRNASARNATSKHQSSA